MIGIDPETNLCYEGVSGYGYGLWPTPLLLRATFILRPEDWAQVPSSGDLRGAMWVFREDFFDPVARIRRGRFYDTHGIRSQPDQWYTHKHPVLPEDVGHRNHQGQFSKRLVTFTPMARVSEKLEVSRDPLVVMGAQPAVSAWSVVAVERGNGDQDVVTLKARLNFGFLPDVVEGAIPAAGRDRVLNEIAKVVDAAHRQSGRALVDLCRAALNVILAEWLVGQGSGDDVRHLDVGQLIGRLPVDRALWRNTSEIINRLHPRGKPNEQVRLAISDVTEADGGLALDALAFLLRDLGWAK